MEYSTLYDLAIEVLKKERVEVTTETIHSKLDWIASLCFCFNFIPNVSLISSISPAIAIEDHLL